MLMHVVKSIKQYSGLHGQQRWPVRACIRQFDNGAVSLQTERLKLPVTFGQKTKVLTLANRTK